MKAGRKRHLSGVSPSLKACGIPGRARLFEVVQKVREAMLSVDAMLRTPVLGKSSNAPELKANPLGMDYIVAMARMAATWRSALKFTVFILSSSRGRYSRLSIDEVFIDATSISASTI